MGDWSFFLRDTGGGETYLHWMMTAWGWTLAVAVLALIVALVTIGVEPGGEASAAVGAAASGVATGSAKI